MGCFGGGSASSRREADLRRVAERYSNEAKALQGEVAQLSSALSQVRDEANSALAEADEKADMAQREARDLRDRLRRKTGREEEAAEHTVALIQEVAELKRRLREAEAAGGGGGNEEGSDDSDDDGETALLRRQLREAREEARAASQETSSLTQQLYEARERANRERAELRNEIQRLKSGSVAGSASVTTIGDERSDASDLYGLRSDLASRTSGSVMAASMADGDAASPSGASRGGRSLRSFRSGRSGRSLSSRASEPAKSTKGAFENVIKTVSLTSGFIGSFGSSSGERSGRSSGEGNVVTPTAAAALSRGQTAAAAAQPNIDAEVVESAIACVDELIRRVNESRSKKAAPFVTPSKAPMKKSQSFGDVLIAGMEDLMSLGGGRDDATTSVGEGASFYSAGGESTAYGDGAPSWRGVGAAGGSPTSRSAARSSGASRSMRSMRSARSSHRSPAQSSSSVADGMEWKPVGTTGELMAVSDDDASTICTADHGDHLDLDDESLFSGQSARSAPILSRKERNESAVIIADLYRVQNLLSSVLEGRPHVKQELQSTMLPQNFASAQSGASVSSSPNRTSNSINSYAVPW